MESACINPRLRKRTATHYIGMKKSNNKNEAAAELGAKGGRARWRKISKADRALTMRSVAIARWEKVKIKAI